MSEPASEPIAAKLDSSKEEETAFLPALRQAMDSARMAQARWAGTPLSGRLISIRKLRSLIAQHCWELAEASASARRRPMQEMLTAEVVPLAEACRFLEREAIDILATRRVGRRGLPLWLAGIRSEVSRDPLGIILIIGPGNYPLLLPGVQLVQALVAGNAVILKPGLGGSKVARLLVDLILRAGIDPALITLLPESAEAAHAAIQLSPDKVLFTGSAVTGEIILSQLAPHLVPATMELSGCDAVIIRDDADIALAASAVAFGLMLNAGATCMVPKRVFISGAHLEAFKRELIQAIQNRLEDEPSHPSITAKAASVATPTEMHLRSLLEDAIDRGASVIYGKVNGEASFELPIILANVSPSASVLRDDIFLPILAVITVADDDDAIKIANNCPFALGAAVFSRDEFSAHQLAARIRAGVVTINDLIIPTADARLPFGGRGHSGFGVTRGREGLLELTTPKVVTISRGKFRPAFAKPHPEDKNMFDAYFKLAHGKGVASGFSAIVSLFRSIVRRAFNQSKKI